MVAREPSVYVADTGRPGDELAGKETSFGWAGFRDGAALAYDPGRHHSISALSDALIADLADPDRLVAFGVEHVVWVPVPAEAERLLKQREVADAAAPGASSSWCGRFAVFGLVRGLQLTPWILTRVAEGVEGLSATVSQGEWSRSGARLLVFETYVAGRAHAPRGELATSRTPTPGPPPRMRPWCTTMAR